MKKQKFHRWTKLRKALKNAGLTYDRTILLKHETKGNLILRKNANGFRFVTDQDIKEIVEAYSPGGTMKWSYKK